MKFPDVSRLGSVAIEDAGRFTMWLVKDGGRTAARRLAEATAAEHRDCTYPPCEWGEMARAALAELDYFPPAEAGKEHKRG